MNIQDIISDLPKTLNNSPYYFLHGGCLSFAIELQKIIGGSLRYLKEENHVVLQKNEKLYDASGNVSKAYRQSPFLTEYELFKRKKLLSELGFQSLHQ